MVYPLRSEMDDIYLEIRGECRTFAGRYSYTHFYDKSTTYIHTCCCHDHRWGDKRFRSGTERYSKYRR